MNFATECANSEGMKIKSWLWKNWHQSWVVVMFCVGVVAGVILGLVMRVNYFGSGWWIGFVVAVLIVAYLKPQTAFVGLALVAGMVVAFFRVSVELMGAEYVRGLVDKEVIVMGVVEGDPEEDEGVLKLKLGGLKFGCEVDVDTDECTGARGSIYVTTRAGPGIERSDTVVLAGRMLGGFGTYVGYMYQPTVEQVLKPEPGDFVLMVRNWFAGRIAELIPEKESALGLSYLLGMKTGLDRELAEDLRTVGLVHIVVASGAHLSILVEVARKIFGKLSRFSALLVSIVFTVFFMMMVGWTPSILRAGVMVILTLLAWYVGRKIAPWRLILMVAAFTLMLNPNNIINLGWQLSFAAYSGIMMLGPRLTKFFYGQRKPGFVAGVIITTMSATVMTLPITLYHYGMVSLISVAANLLILPTLPAAMGLVFATGAVAGVPGVAMVVAWCATKLLDFHIAIVGWFGEMRSFVVEIPTYKVEVFGIYLVVLAVLLIGHLRKKVVKLREAKRIGVIKMSGHSKWATTKRQKAVVDAKRGALFTKIGNQIAIAARAGTDPAMNPSLAMVLEKARLANMPKANIERAIARVADKSAAALIEEVYEAYGPGGVGIVIEVATDNKNRTMPEVRHTLDKNGGRMADPGSVMFQFARKGVIEISEKGDDAVMVALEAGAEDASDEDEGTVIYTAASDLMKVRQALIDAGMTVTSAELQYVPNSYVPVEGENAEKLEKLLAAVDDLDDVTNVYTNAE